MAGKVTRGKYRHYVFEGGKKVLKAEDEMREIDPATLPPKLRKQYDEFMKQYGNKRKPA